MFERAEQNGIEYFHFAPWTQSGVLHGFLGAGVDSRNDSRRCDEIARSICRSDSLPIRRLRQIHSDKVVTLDFPNESEADGWLAEGREPAILGIETADCAPVLIVSRDRKMFAALHCGWRGTVSGLLKNAFARFHECGVKPDSIELVVGPCAGSCCYEFGEDLIRSELHGDDRNAVSERNGKFYLDLRTLLKLQARALGVPEAGVQLFPGCTICDFRFFSFRRQKAHSGRQLSFISSGSVGNFHK